MRTYKTISEQNHYDLAAQKFGSLDGLYGVLKAMPSTFDVNDVLPFELEVTLENTENNLGLLFDANNSYFSTGNSIPEALASIFDETFDETFE